MNPRARDFLSRGWWVTFTSLAAISMLVFLLRSPWNRKGPAHTGPLRLYCAAGMTKPITELLADYQTQYSVQVEATYDGSGKLLSTIRAAGGRGDLYLAADASHMRIAKRDGLVAEVIPVAHLYPAVVLSAATQRELEKTGKPITSLKDVLREDLKLVLANPEQASIGQLSKEIFEKFGLWKRVQEGMRASGARVSTVGTVQEVVQAVRTREGIVGIAWSANALQMEGMHAVVVPEMKGFKETLQLGVLAKSSQPTAALRLVRYLTAADRGSETFKRHHYSPLEDADLWAETPSIQLSAGAMLLPGIEEAIKEFAEREGAQVETNFAGCGLLVGQMKGIKGGQTPGRFPDAYFACDDPFLADVQEWFEPGKTLAANPLILVVPRGNPKNIQGLPDLTRDDLRVGLAHPKNSAAGKLTERLLKRLDVHYSLYDEDRQAPVVHADAAHLLVNQMRTGALDAAVVYRSNVLSAPINQEHLEVIELGVPDALARQPFAVARETRHPHLTRRLLAALAAPTNAARFRALGFQWLYEAP